MEAGMKEQPVSEIEQLDGSSLDIAAEKRRELLKLFPEVGTEGGKIDYALLKLALGEAVDAGRERYGLMWSGKADCFKTIQALSMATLLPKPDKSVNFETTENVVIEGDNLEVLKILQKSYLGKVKMIYLDPPYNTGNDFIYPDNYSESLQTYLEYTGQVDAKGHKFGTNTDTDGRFHSKWLNMMYPRLYLARNLLREDGLLFVSINDDELDNLRFLLNSIFGDENFIGTLVWKSRHNVDSRNKTGLSRDHEYVLCYGRRLVGSAIDEGKYSNRDGDERGPWMSDNMVGLATREQRPNLHYNLVNPATNVDYGCPEKGWRYEKATMDRKIREGRVLWPTARDGRPREKRFLAELRSRFTGLSSLLDVPTTMVGTQEVRELLGEAIFDFPKPRRLVEVLINQATLPLEGDICLDLFAGSGTTGAAVYNANAKDGGNRRFVLVQLPEPTSSRALPTVADIAEERLRRAGSQMVRSAGLPMESSDIGFRVFTLAESNVEPWDSGIEHDEAALKAQMSLGIDHLRRDRTDLDVLYEVILKEGFQLSSRVENETIAGKTAYSIAGGAFLICLERHLDLGLLRAIAERKPERVLLLDEGFAGNDQLKTNAVQTFKSKNIVLKTL
jgi:adenine-specific DNA-methyltransferase